jgi:hypothetical protein
MIATRKNDLKTNFELDETHIFIWGVQREMTSATLQRRDRIDPEQ